MDDLKFLKNFYFILEYWKQEEKGMTEDEMDGWHHWLNGHEFEQALEDGEGQGSLACCSPRGCKESDTTERLNWTEFLPTVYSEISIYRKVQITLMNGFTNNPRWALLWLLPRPRIRWKAVQQGRYNWETLQREICQECWWMGLRDWSTRFFWAVMLKTVSTLVCSPLIFLFPSMALLQLKCGDNVFSTTFSKEVPIH